MTKKRSHKNQLDRTTAPERAKATAETWWFESNSTFPSLERHILAALKAHAKATLARAKRRKAVRS